MTAHDSTRPVILRRMAARRQQEVSAGQLQALRRAGSAVFDLALVVDRKRDELRASGTHPWDADPATASLFLAAWNAQVLYTLGTELLDSDAREDPSTAGFVPVVTYRQVWSLLEPVGRWIALARRAEANSDFWIGSDADLPTGLPQMLVPRLSPESTSAACWRPATPSTTSPSSSWRTWCPRAHRLFATLSGSSASTSCSPRRARRCTTRKGCGTLT